MAKAAASPGNEKNYILALDAGGTMTDTILVKPGGDFTIGKSLTNRDDEASSYLESVEDAALNLGLKSTDVHSQASVAIYAGTGMLNTLLNNVMSDTDVISTLQTQGSREEEIRTEKVKKYIEDLAGLPESLLTFGMLGPIILALVGLFPQLMGDMSAMLGMNMDPVIINMAVGGGLFVTFIGMALVGMKAHFKDPGL